MSFDHQTFSRLAKLVFNEYLSGEKYDLNPLELMLRKLTRYDLRSIKSDADRLVFWINVYNGFTNYQIVKLKLKNSVFDKPDFFTDRCLRIGEIDFSLDDIEHGILRRNGDRKNEKPRQLSAEDERLNFVVNNIDYRIHFALNCGSVSCPPNAYYEAVKIDQQLRLAEESFSQSEFVIDHKKRAIECSSIFVWYRKDFGNRYLNAPELSRYKIIERPYIWKIR